MSEGFIHSVRVPRLYKTVAKIVQNVQENGASLKHLIYQQRHTNVQGVFALAFNTIRHGDQLNQLIRKSQILFKEQRLDPWLTRVLITELIWGKQCLKSESKPIQTVLSYVNELREGMKNITEDVNCPETQKVGKPRYVRVNTLKTSVDQAILNFQDEGWNFVSGFQNYSSFLETVSKLEEEAFVQDFHIPELLIFPQGTTFFKHDGYRSGSIILQDKASCFPAFLLNPPSGSSVLDMCSAPGMKSTHLAAIMQNQGKIFSVEMDERRFKTLCDFIQMTDSTCVETINKDALTIDSTQCPDIEYILVDPSCSGSGMIDREKINGGIEKCAPGRLRSLQSFQVLLLRHALLNFRSVKKVVYSTCSLHPEENELVIDEILSDIGEAYRLISPKESFKENWINCSSLDYKCKDNCLYARPEVDLTNGFFVAVFERNFDIPLPEYKRKVRAKGDSNFNSNHFRGKRKGQWTNECEENQENGAEGEEGNVEKGDESEEKLVETSSRQLTASQKKRMRKRRKLNQRNLENSNKEDVKCENKEDVKCDNKEDVKCESKEGFIIDNKDVQELEDNSVTLAPELEDDNAKEKIKKKKKNKHNKPPVEEEIENDKCYQKAEDDSLTEISKKKKTSKENTSTEMENLTQEGEEDSLPKKRKKKKDKLVEEKLLNNINSEESEKIVILEEVSVKSEKKNKKHKNKESTEDPVTIEVDVEGENISKKKKKKKKVKDDY